MDVLVLGPVEVWREGARVPIGGPKQRGIVALLAANMGNPLSLDQIVEGIYGDAASEGSGRSVRTFISAIRRELSTAVDKDANGYSLVVDSASIDAVRFEEQVRAVIPSVEDDPASAAAAIREALSLWRGHPYADVNSTGVFTPEITRLGELRLAALEARIDADLATGRHRELVGELEALITEHPFHERFRAQHMLALYRCDRQADALRAFERARKYLAEELGIDPSSSLRDLEQQMLVQDPALHLVAARGVPDRSNLPARISSFVGRSEETKQVETLVGKHRLVTLTGLGGIGKTTLAVEVARRIAAGWTDGARLVELAPISDPMSVVAEVARVLGVAEYPTRSLLDVIVEELAPRSLLVVVDNCEHVLEEAARVVATLIERCHSVHVLTTSRAPLKIPGERPWPVPPLDLPDHEAEPSEAEIAESGSVRLYLDRVHEADPSFVLDEANLAGVAAICRKVEGIPLALELAAARLNVLSTGQLLDRLEGGFAAIAGGGPGRPRRQRTLLATMKWSYDLLRASEQVLLQRLAVFRGGFGLEAVEAVCAGDGIAVVDVLDSLSHLLDASLLTSESGETVRYRMLESVRQYAASLLAHSGAEAIIRAQHADYYGNLVPLEPDFDSAEFGEMLEQVADERDNFLEALAWAVAVEDGDRALRLAVDLSYHWFFGAHAEESLHWLPRVLRITDQRPSVLRVRVLAFLATHLMFSGDRHGALAAIEEAEAMEEQLDNTQLTTETVFIRAGFLQAGGDLRGSRDLLLEHVKKTRHLDMPALSLNLSVAAGLSVMLGDFELAASLNRELKTRGAALQQPMAMAWTDSLQGTLAHYQGDLSAADQKCRDALRELTRLGRTQDDEALRELGRVALARGELESAEGWARGLIDVGRGNLVTGEMVDGHTVLARVALRKDLVVEAGHAAAQALDLTVASDDKLALAEVLAVVGQCAWASGKAAASALLHSGAEALRGSIGFVHPAPRAQELQCEYADIRGALGTEAFEQAWQRGISLSRGNLVAQARTVLASAATMH